jgi:hypothetical protein
MTNFKMTKHNGLTYLSGSAKGDIEINAPDEDFVIEDSLECDGAISIVGQNLSIRGVLKSGSSIDFFVSAILDNQGSIIAGYNNQNQDYIISGHGVIEAPIPVIGDGGIIISSGSNIDA